MDRIHTAMAVCSDCSIGIRMDFFRADGVDFSNIFTIFVYLETKRETDYEQVYQYIG